MNTDVPANSRTSIAIPSGDSVGIAGVTPQIITSSTCHPIVLLTMLSRVTKRVWVVECPR